MTVLVTGASGYLGRAVAERLTSDGARVLGLIRRPEASLPSGVRPVLIDLEGTVRSTKLRVVEEDEVHIWHFDPKGKVSRFRHRADTFQHWAASF